MSFHIDEYIEQPTQVFTSDGKYIEPPTPRHVRNAAKTRATYAADRGMYYFERAYKSDLKSGNIMSCLNMQKYLQARRIYVHYTNEYQQCLGLPLTK